MQGYRLHIDIPLGNDEETAINTANLLMSWCFYDDRHQCMKMKQHGINGINYRLGYDEDRQKSNHLTKNENGHIGNKKSRIEL